MIRVYIALIVTCFVSSQLNAQNAEVSRERIAHGVRPSFAWTTFNPQFYPPYYDYYYSYNDNSGLRSLWNFYAFWRSVDEQDRPQASYGEEATEPSRVPATPATPMVREYHWPEQVDAPAPFSIVTTSGTEYLATMVWVEGGNVHLNSVDGGALQIPLASVSRSLTKSANAQKKLNLPLP